LSPKVVDAESGALDGSIARSPGVKFVQVSFHFISRIANQELRPIQAWPDPPFASQTLAFRVFFFEIGNHEFWSLSPKAVDAESGAFDGSIARSPGVKFNQVSSHTVICTALELESLRLCVVRTASTQEDPIKQANVRKQWSSTWCDLVRSFVELSWSFENPAGVRF
jgi:hypothetical protein